MNIDILHVLIWAFVSEIILLIIFEKNGVHIKNRLSGFFRTLNPYINSGYYILSFFVVLIIAGIVEQSTNFVDSFLLNLVGSVYILWAMVISFDIFWVSNKIVGLNIKNRWCWIPLAIFIFFFLIFIVLKLV